MGEKGRNGGKGRTAEKENAVITTPNEIINASESPRLVTNEMEKPIRVTEVRHPTVSNAETPTGSSRFFVLNLNLKKILNHALFICSHCHTLSTGTYRDLMAPHGLVYRSLSKFDLAYTWIYLFTDNDPLV